MTALLLAPTVRALESFAPATLEFAVEHREASVTVLRIQGDATAEQAADLDQALRSCLDARPALVILDLASLSTLEPEAAQTLVAFARDVGRDGVEVWLTGLRPAIWLALAATRSERLFTIRDTLGQALAS